MSATFRAVTVRRPLWFAAGLEKLVMLTSLSRLALPFCLWLGLVTGLPLRGGEALPGAESQSPADGAPKRRLNRDRFRQFRARRQDQSIDSPLNRMTWKVGDVNREALVYVPPALDKKAPGRESKESREKAPVIFAFHGHGGRAEYSVRKMAFHKLWPEAICVYPQGLPTAVPVIDMEGRFPGWQKHIGDQEDRDLAFFDVMLKSLQADYPIDAQRIYSTGHSNGGFFTYVLWAARGERLAAVAPIAALLDLRDVKDQKPKPVLHVAGEQDPIVKFASQQRTMELDRRLNGCDQQGKPAGEWCTEYSSRQGPPVITYIHPGGHEIPEGAPERIVQFFREHPQR